MIDKSFWRTAVQADYAVPDGHTATELMPALLAGLKSTDPELRDNLCYELLAVWVQRGHFSPVDCRRMLPELMANLQTGLGDGENDDLFGRTFSVLILGEIVARDGKAAFLADAAVGEILEAGLEYLAAEQDLRGYVPDKGWAHSAAHTADLMMALAGHSRLGAAELQRVLDAIGAKVLAPTQYSFVDSDGFRLARSVIAVLQREVVPVGEVVAWVDRVGLTDRRAAFVAGRDNAWHHNTTALLTALHVLLTYQAVPSTAQAELLPAVHRALKSFMPWFL